VYVDAHRLRTFDGDAEIVPGIRSVSSRGHTPGHSFYAVESKGQKLLLWGDLIHAGAVQFPSPSTTIRFDVDSSAAAVQRNKAFADAARQGYWVGAAHISFPGIGHVRSAGKGYDWIPANYSAW
jgi:glyoxylase-like metal-dependent hydrolase (beta-lactamase superfamily II)